MPLPQTPLLQECFQDPYLNPLQCPYLNNYIPAKSLSPFNLTQNTYYAERIIEMQETEKNEKEFLNNTFFVLIDCSFIY